MGTSGPERHELYSRTQVVAIVLLVTILGLGLALTKQRSLASVSVTSGNSSDYAFRVNVNTASWEELALLPGLGPKKAQAIVAHREAFGQFTSADDLAKVPGIGEKTAANVAQFASFGAK
jgi:competence protein ComEA